MLISGLTVLVAMSGMFVVAHPVFSSFAIGTMMVVAVAMVGSITVVPATLAALGDRIDKGRLPLTGRRGRTGESGVWAAIIRRVLGRPWLAAGAATALLLVLAAPTLRLHTADAGAQALPRDLAVMRTYDRIQRAFPGGPLPAVVAVQIPRGRALSVTVALKELRERALATGLLQAPFGFSINDERTVAVITMAVAGKGTDATSDRALAALRDEVLPATLESKPGVRTYVSGTTAMSHDFNALMRARAPWVFAFVLVARLPAAAVDVPLARDRAHRGRAQPAVGRRGVRDPGLVFQDGNRGVAARLQLDRRHHVVAAAVPVRDPVRAVDGLPRLRPQPHPRGPRSRHEHRARPWRTASPAPPGW